MRRRYDDDDDDDDDNERDVQKNEFLLLTHGIMPLPRLGPRRLFVLV